jgi:hypothetical protein
VDLEHPENNAGLLIHLGDHNISGTLQKYASIVAQRVHPADYMSGKYKAWLMSPTQVKLQVPSIQFPMMDGAGQQITLLDKAKSRDIIDDRGEDDLKIHLNAIARKVSRQTRFMLLDFPKHVHLSNHLFSPGAQDASIKSKQIFFPIQLEMGQGPKKATHNLIEMYIFWRIAVVEEHKRVIDGVQVNEELDDILDSMSGMNI